MKFWSLKKLNKISEITFSNLNTQNMKKDELLSKEFLTQFKTEKNCLHL